MATSAPGKDHREGISILKLFEMFPDEDSAKRWFEEICWPNGSRHCPNCGSVNTYECSHAKMPYKCRERECGKYFSVKTGTVMAQSKVPLRKWVFAIYLDTTSLKGISSMKLHRDIEVTQKTAWFMLQRIREAWAERGGSGPGAGFSGPVEVDETYVGGQRRNMSHAKRRALREAGVGSGGAGKAIVVGAKDRATNQVSARTVEAADRPTLHGFVIRSAAREATVYTDEAAAYNGIRNHHESVRHSTGEYVRGEVHTNGIESFWSMLKRAHKGTFHKLSPKHLNRYVQEFVGRHNMRELGTMEQMETTSAKLIGKRLTYARLIADNGLASGARPG